MGGGSWSDDAYRSLSTNYATKSADQIFNKSEDKEMSPYELGIRESRDSDEHPESLAVMVFLDVTGSMGRIPEAIIKEKLGSMMSTLIDNGIEHPQILFGAIGDHKSDNSPLQVGQFESSTDKLDKWLSSIYIEGYGGGQKSESYSLAWLTAGSHTSIDCYEKRNVKGFLFTIGDEMAWSNLDRQSIKEILGYKEPVDMNDKQLLKQAEKMYNVYHIHVNEGSYADDPEVIDYWRDMLGERLIVLDDYKVITETIGSIIAMQHGVDLDRITSKFSGDVKNTVTNAIAHIGGNDITQTNSGVGEF